MLVGQGDGNLWLFIASLTWGDFFPTVIGDPYGYLAAFTIPIVLIIVGAVGQKLVERPGGPLPVALTPAG